jgi:hypothetical protein
LVLDSRHALGLTMVFSIGLAYLLAVLVRTWPARGTRLTLPAAAIALVLAWAFAVSGPSKLGYLKDTGEWIAREVPKEAVVLTNDGRIAYFSARPYETFVRVWVTAFAPPTEEALAEIDYFAFVTSSPTALPDFLDRLPKRLVRTFPGRDGRTVMVFVKQ